MEHHRNRHYRHTGSSWLQQKRTRLTKNKLKRRNQERFGEDGTYLGISLISSSQETRMASECSPMRPPVCGINQGQGQALGLVPVVCGIRPDPKHFHYIHSHHHRIVIILRWLDCFLTSVWELQCMHVHRDIPRFMSATSWQLFTKMISSFTAALSNGKCIENIKMWMGDLQRCPPLQFLGMRLHDYASAQLYRCWRICTAPLFIALHTNTTRLISATWMCPSH